jgi:diamine N-acetyltransferase
MMQVTLQPVSRENWRACARLELQPHQEGFVAPNVYSLAQALTEPEDCPLVIYASDTVVGFMMYEQSTDDGTYWLFRFLIGRDYQEQGYGRAAMLALLQRLRALPDCAALWLSVAPDNVAAERLYRSLGFVPTGSLDDSGEPIFCLRLE